MNPDNAGLYTLRVIKAEDEETEFGYWQDMVIPGIYNLSNNKFEGLNSMEIILTGKLSLSFLKIQC